MQIGIRYCGGCNPRYDRVAAAEQLKALFPEVNWLYAGPETKCDGIVVVTGCGKECVATDNLGEYGGRLVYMNKREDIPGAEKAINAWIGDGGDRRKSVRIRRMTETDLPQILEIETENFSVPWSEKSFRDMLCRPEAVFLVAEEITEKQTAEKTADPDEDVPYLAGYAGAVTACDQGDVTNIAVRNVRKRCGIGDMLLKCLLSEAHAKGVEEMFLEVREHNEPAKRLYRSNRFAEVGIRKGYYTDTQEDAILMKRNLSEEGKTEEKKDV